MTESAAYSALQIASLLELAPGWVRVGLTAPDERIRRDAVQHLAEYIAIGLERSCDHRNQLVLPL